MHDRRVADVAAKVFHVLATELDRDTHLGSLEAWDSLGHLQLIVTIESEFKVRFQTERIPELTTLGLIADELERSAT